MRPFTVLIGIVLGSAASFSFGLAAVLVIYTVLVATRPELAHEHPELAHDLPRLLSSLAAFVALTASSAGSFVGQMRSRPWRGWAHLATVACVGLIALLYWPRR